MKLIKINHEQRLYVIECGKGYTCLGFDVLERWASRLANALGSYWDSSKPDSAQKYEAYTRLTDFAHTLFMKTGIPIQCELHPAFHGLLHKRVEILYEDGRKERFRVGQSTGWVPVYLKLHNSRSKGGEAIDRDTKIVRVRQIS